MTNAMVLRPQTFDQLETFANMAAKSALVPRDYQGKPENIMLAVQMGSEIGLAPMQALQNIAVVNGRPSVWGDAMLALCKTHPAWAGISERIEGDGDAMRGICEIQRRGDNPVSVSFSVADAKRAGLWGKPGPWTQYPQRMLQMRARGFALRDAFPDALKGLISAEEARDIPVDTFAGTTIDAKAEPAAPRVEPTSAGTQEHTPEQIRDWLMGQIARAEKSEHMVKLSGHQLFIDRMALLNEHNPDMAEAVSSAMIKKSNSLIIPEATE